MTVETGLETAESLPDARIVHTGQQPEITHPVTQAEYSLIVSCLTITFLQPLQLASKDHSSLFTVMLLLNSIIVTLFWIMFQSTFSCHYWTPLANALMLWDYILGMKCFDTLMFNLSKVRELKNVYTNTFVNYKNIFVFYVSCMHLFLHRFTKIIPKIQVHIRQFRDICHVLFFFSFSSQGRNSSQSTKCYTFTYYFIFRDKCTLGTLQQCMVGGSSFLSVRDLSCPDVSCEFAVYQPFLQSPKIHLQTTLAT